MKILIIGYGRTGKSTEQFLKNKNIEYVIFDDFANNGIIGDPHKIPWNDINLAILSPGIPTWDQLPPVVILCRKKGIPIVSDMDMFYKYHSDKNFIAITGSQGKTTLHDAIYKFMEKEKASVSAGGNNGIPVLSLEPKDEILLEVSMQQLFLNQWILFNMGIFINFVDTHQEFGDFFHRLSAKRRLFIRSKDLDQRFIIGDFPKGIQRFLGTAIKEKDIIIYSDNFHSWHDVTGNNYVFVKFIDHDNSHNIIYNIDDKKGEFMIKDYGFNLISQENLGVLWAFCCLKGYTDEDKFINFLKDYQLVDHRISLIREVGKFKFFNSSKCTNGFALKTLKKYINYKHPGKNYWILGGVLNSPIENFDNQWDKDHIYIYGKDGPKIYEFLKSKYDKIVLKDNLEEIIKEIQKDLQEEKEIINVLLTPGCQSFDQFKDFEHRGITFKTLIEDLKF
jgi:UDP-N-acetylmuramoylalanine--D-glutamate ligase